MTMVLSRLRVTTGKISFPASKMRFPALDVLPTLTVDETEDWSYPVFEGRPYTKLFANKLVDLSATEDRFWRHLKFVKQYNAFADIYFDLHPHGSLSLPKWSFTVQGHKFESQNTATTLLVKVDKTARLHKEVNSTETITLNGDYSSRLSELGTVVRYMLPYVEAIYIVTDEDQASLIIP